VCVRKSKMVVEKIFYGKSANTAIIFTSIQFCKPDLLDVTGKGFAYLLASWV
jgi:hypothetical protein